MRRFLIVLSLLASAPAAMACPPVVDDGGTSFGFGGYGASAGFGAGGCGGGGGFGYGAGSCGAPAMAFSAPSYGYSAMVAAPVYSAPVVRRRAFGVGSYGYGGFAAPVRVRSFAAPVYAAPVVAAPVQYAAPIVAAPVYGGFGASVVVAPRAPGPIRGAVQGFFGGVRNRLNGF